MKLNDLKTGMVVEYENNTGMFAGNNRRIIIGENFIGQEWCTLNWNDKYNYDLTNKYREELNINKVYTGLKKLDDLYSDNLDLIWERKWTPRLEEEYWTVDFSREEYIFKFSWEEDRFDKRLYKEGLIFKTRQEAIETANEILQLIKGKNKRENK